MKKRCYICIPILNREEDAVLRAKAAAEAIEGMGYEPVNPLDLNNVIGKELTSYASDDQIAWFMGRDISTIISQCDAVYCCDGWKQSRGCNVERECAKRYGKTIFYQTPYDEREDDAFINVINKTYEKYIDLIACSNDYESVDHLKGVLKKYKYYMDLFFDVRFDEDENKFMFN